MDQMLLSEFRWDPCRRFRLRYELVGRSNDIPSSFSAIRMVAAEEHMSSSFANTSLLPSSIKVSNSVTTDCVHGLSLLIFLSSSRNIRTRSQSPMRAAW